MDAVIDIVEINPGVQALVKEAEAVLKQYEGYAITTQEQYEAAADKLKEVKRKSTTLESVRKSMTKPLDDSKSRIMDFFRFPADNLAKTESIIKRALLSYQQEQERKRREEEARLAEIQRKEAEKLAKRAEKAEVKGNTAKAEELRLQAASTAAITPVVSSQVKKVAGIETKKIWKYRIVDVTKIPREYMIPNEVMIGNMARSSKGTLAIPGVEIYAEETIAAGR